MIYIEQIKFKMERIITNLHEFLAAQPATKPTTAPPKTTPATPSRPSPIRRDKPAVKPKPQAKIEDVVKKLMAELKKKSEPFELDIKKLKQAYGTN